MDFLYGFEQQRNVTKSEWILIHKRVVQAFETLVSSSIYKAVGDVNAKVDHWSGLFPPAVLRDNGHSIYGFAIDGQVLAFGGGDIKNPRAEPLVLPQQKQVTTQPQSCYTGGCAYDLLVRYVILIFHNSASGAYHFTVKENNYHAGDAESYWFTCAEVLNVTFGDTFEVPFKFDVDNSKRNQKALLIQVGWQQSIEGVDESYF